MQNSKVIILCIFVAIFVSTATVFVYDRFFATKITVFDMQGYLHGIKVLYMQNKITEADVNKYLDLMDQAVKNRPKNEVILGAEVVYGGRFKKIPYPAKEIEIAAYQDFAQQNQKQDSKTK